MSTSNSETYDIIFAGGGAAACVVAGRLAEVDPSLKILIIEAGAHTRSQDQHVQPGRYLGNMANPALFMHYLAKPSKALDGRQAAVQTGKCVGGGSSVNFMMYTRASASDFDDWEKVGNPGWGSKDLIPLARKLETYEPIASEDLSTHGDSGPIHISRGGHKTDIGDQFLDISKNYDKERGSTDDVNDFSSCNAYGRWQKYIGSKTGMRSDAAHNFIYNQEHNTNLKVLTGQLVKRVLFENNRAIGVEYVDDVDQTASAKKIFASRLVVLSAGAFGSPAILERSGIGAKHILEKNDIPLVVDLPGVGENYNDPHLVLTPYIASSDSDSMKAMFEGKDSEFEPYFRRWKQDGRGLMAHNGIDAGIKIRPVDKDLTELGPEFKKRWDSLYVPAPDKALLWLGPIAGYMGRTPDLQDRKLFTMTCISYYPISSGRTHITSYSPYSPVDFETGFLEEHADVLSLRWAYKRGRELARRMGAYRGEHKPDHPSFLESSSAVVGDASGPVDIDAPDIVYSVDDDKAIDAYHRANVNTTWHSLGTCAMKPLQKMGVVDSRLNVYGIQNLKVAGKFGAFVCLSVAHMPHEDLSIAPSNVGANTYNTTMIIAEKAAIIIAEELGIKGVGTTVNTKMDVFFLV
ncbi:GMC oxidoreductase-domain-containing protein [Desarmillaria tabescens]|uniref:GMC oxidoreductase-domain-containing protein n=1 Tax=Armillaria tabescens TaxID=1929756 RepID=A0AA39JXT3_ARMTA|nr:GMC oxidoreductase-domain-containing protein [Desarmillaria tabescens]KAK0449786.1 GMC oxidoreductase-domain-containing protein [Desarmillaria tabescens]